MTKQDRQIILAAAETAEVAKDINFALLRSDLNGKIQTLAGCAAGLARVIERLQSVLDALDVNPECRG